MHAIVSIFLARAVYAVLTMGRSAMKRSFLLDFLEAIAPVFALRKVETSRGLRVKILKAFSGIFIFITHYVWRVVSVMALIGKDV